MLLFLVDLINIEKFRISFRLFYSFSFILRSRATSIWYQSITSIRDQVIILSYVNLVSESNFDPRSSYFYLFQVLDPRSNLLVCSVWYSRLCHKIH